jgi:hypothetical protein
MRALTLLLLIAAALLAGLALAPAADQPTVSTSQYQASKFCGACHKNAYTEWQNSMHSHASDDPFYAEAFIVAGQDTNGLTDTFCSACHTPLGMLSGEIPPADHSKLTAISKQGVFCDFCHTIEGQKGIGNAQYVIAPGKVKRGPYRDGEAMAHEIAYAEFITKPEFCGTCHDVSHPVNGLALETTYTEWSQGPYNTDDPKVRATCQDCHFTPGTGVTKPNPGKASTVSDERPHVSTHDAVGGGGAAALMNETGIMERAVKMLQAAAQIALVLPEGATAGQAATVKVAVTNVGAGHSIPTGVTELRDMWLEVIVTDAAGKQVFASGELDAAGEITAGAVKYGVVVADAAGQPTPKFWLAASHVSDHRIPPKQTVTETYEAPIPAGVAGPLTVKARLRYRAASPALLRLLMGPDEKRTLPITDMATAQGELKVLQ